MCGHSTVLLENGTVGATEDGLMVDVADCVTVYLRDENGLPIEAKGVVAEVLDSGDKFME